MVTQLDSPDGKPRKDEDRPSPAFVETDPAMQRMPEVHPVSQGDASRDDEAPTSDDPAGPRRDV